MKAVAQYPHKGMIYKRGKQISLRYEIEDIAFLPAQRLQGNVNAVFFPVITGKAHKIGQLTPGLISGESGRNLP